MVSENQLSESSTAWYDQYKSCFWYKILFDSEWLGLDKDFLDNKRESDKPYRQYVNERLLSAAAAMNAIPGEMIAITQLLHTASSVVLLEGKRERVDAALDLIKKQSAFEGIDPTMIVTGVALYFLISDAEITFANSEVKMNAIKHLHKRLDQIKWLISEKAIKTLNIT